MSELKSCPFCGGNATIYPHSWDYEKDSYSIECGFCSCETKLYDTEAEAISAWNTRVGE